MDDLAAANGAALHAAIVEIFKILLENDLATHDQCGAAMNAIASTIEEVAGLSSDNVMIKGMAAEFKATATVLTQGGALGPTLAIIQGGKADDPS